MGCHYIETDFKRRNVNLISEIRLLLRYIRIIQSTSPQIILTYTIKPDIYGAIACRKLGVPYIVNITGLGTIIENRGLIGKISLMLYKFGLKSASCVFFQNEANYDFFIRNKIIWTKTRLIPGSGVNLALHMFEEYPSTKHGICFLFIGRIMRDKGIEELLYAFEIVKKNYPTTSLDIVGFCEENYEKKLEILQEQGFLRFHGLQKNVHEFITKSHCTVLPSYHEGTSNVLLESAATGRPIITTRVPGCQETFDEGISGLGCQERNVKSLVSAMTQFIGLSHHEKVQMGLAGRKKMERQYDRNIVIKAYMEEIADALKGGSNHSSL